jgi:hypothetical protein
MLLWALRRQAWPRQAVLLLVTAAVLVVVGARAEKEGVGQLSVLEIEERLQVWDGIHLFF